MENKCILWEGAKSKKGYGVIRVSRKAVYVHQLSYRLFNGGIPKGLLVCHKCDVRNCINPTHLFLGTAKDNTDDMTNKGRGLYGRRPLELINIITNEKIPFNTQKEAGKFLGVTQSAVSYAIRRNTKINNFKIYWNSPKPLPIQS